MERSDVFLDMLIEAELVSYFFKLRSPSFSASEASDLMGWIIEEFTMKRCAWLAGAIATEVGREHYISFNHPDGRLAHAIIATSPQHDLDLKGSGCDVLGRRPIKKIQTQLETLNDRIIIEIGTGPRVDEFEPGELKLLLELAKELPWTARVLRSPLPTPDGPKLRDIAYRLGMMEFPATPTP